MTTWQAKINQLEASLQSLIEGYASLIFPQRDIYSSLPARFVEAMQVNLQTDLSGNFYAPNLLTLEVHPSIIDVFQENHGLLDELANLIQQSGKESGFQFYDPPTIRLMPDPNLPTDQVRIQAQFSSQSLGKTSTLAINTDQIGEAIPENAFLIVAGKHIFPLNYGVVNIGRRIDNHLSIDDKRVSRLHAQLRAINGRYIIFDLDSKGGTFVNGERVNQSLLQPGDVISLAGVPLVYSQDTEELSGQDLSSTLPILP